jgi:hypothetical protein
MVHGDEALQVVLQTTDALFKRPISEVCRLPLSEFISHFSHTKILELPMDQKVTLSGIVSSTGLRKTRADAKRVIQ